jgi:superfamily II DNA/RNA helicase
MTTNFNAFGLPPKLLQALERMKFTTPTPIQEQAIPMAMEGRDILGSAQTGTGKTGAFGIPVIAKLTDNPQAAALIMTPTRELAAQVMAALQQMIPVPSIKTALLIGGEPMPKQFRQLQMHPRLIVGTPGRINDHLARGTLKLNNVRFLVLDETDRMLDMGFGIQIEKIVNHIPKERQTMLFSATLPPDIVKLSSKYMNNPQRISAGSTTDAAPNIEQELIHTTDVEKYTRLMEQLAKHKGSAIIFVKTKFGTEKLAAKLTRDNHRSDAIHGDLRQTRRDRVIQGFRDKKFRVLVATDLAARGLDVPHIELVINYDLPQAPEDYIHRIGRTARAGASGRAINMLTSADRIKWNAIQRLMNPNAPREQFARSEGGGERNYRKGGKPFGKRPYGAGAGATGSRGKPFGKPRFNDGDAPREHARADRPHSDRPHSDRPHSDRPHSDRPHSDRPRSDRPHSDRPRHERTERVEGASSDRPHARPHSDRPRTDRPRSDRPHSDRPRHERSEAGARSERPHHERSHSDRPHADRPHSDRPRTEHAPKHRDAKSHDGKEGASPFAKRSFKGNKFKSGGGKGGYPKTGDRNRVA